MDYITHPELIGVKHGFFTRKGGVSSGVYTSANTAYNSADNQAHIHENRLRCKTALGIDRLITLNQVHGNVVHTLTHDNIDAYDTLLNGDGFVSTIPNVGLGVLTADCAPVLFADRTHNVVGACHAGWNGALQGVMLHTIDKMQSLGAKLENIIAVIGPTIAQTSYEVDIDFQQNFCKHNAENQKYFKSWHHLDTHIPASSTTSYGFDLSTYIYDTLNQKNIKTYALNMDTYTRPDIFFSYRRSTHQGHEDYGRQISIITL